MSSHPSHKILCILKVNYTDKSILSNVSYLNKNIAKRNPKNVSNDLLCTAQPLARVRSNLYVCTTNLKSAL